MKCVSCGLPLSPTRTHCPRCGTASNGEPAKQNDRFFNQVEVPQQAFPPPQFGNGFSGSQGQVEMSPQQWRSQSPATPWEAQTVQGMPFTPQPSLVYQQAGNDMPLPTQFPTLATQPSTQSGQLRLPGTGGDSQPGQAVAWKPVSQPRLDNQPRRNSGAVPQFPQPPRKYTQTAKRQPARLSLTIAGLCVLTGGLILIFVYIISLSLPPATIGNQSNPATIATTTAQGLVPTTQGTAPTTSQVTPAITPTVSLPGQSYIDTAQMASSVNTYTAQPTQLANSFNVKQQIFVTFMLHPKITGGAVCLLWYLNQKEFSRYAFAVNATPQLAYSYAYAGSPGPGSVEIYWASTIACTDKALAQVVNFTINP